MIDNDSLIKKLQKLNAKKIFLQVPEGLKTKVQKLSTELEEAGFYVMISVEPCFGACDIKDREAKDLGCDVLVHVGHSSYGLKPVVPVIFEEYRIDINPTSLLKRHINELKEYKNIGLVTTVQYISSLGKASIFLKKQGKKIFLGTPKRAVHPGQILGCDYSGAKEVESSVDCFLFLGSGSFHPLGLSLATEKPVLFLDFESGELIDLAQEKFNVQKIRYANIAKAADARNFGIIVSTKPGQSHPKIAIKTKEKLEKLGRRAWILVADMITPDKLLGFDIEALVDTACPRIRDDSRLFKKPIISPEDIDMFE